MTSIKENLPSVVCTVENVHGKDSISYTVRVVKPPVAPTIRVSKITASSITLSWNSPHNGGALLQGNVASALPSLPVPILVLESPKNVMLGLICL